MNGEKLSSHYMDLHIHLGRDMHGNAVKITASDQLTLQNVLNESVERKGLDIIGIIDCLSPAVLEELQMLLEEGSLWELPGGGLSWQGRATLIPGAELEIFDDRCRGPVHVLCYFPGLEEMAGFSRWCDAHITNLSLSTQRIYTSAVKLQKRVKEAGGWFIPAHVFTPFKSIYGKGVETYMEEVLDLQQVDAVELGLSADSSLAGMLPELQPFSFITSSDAHSLKRIAREHQIVKVASPSYAEVERAVKKIDGRQITANVGLHPQLGKYYRSVCRECLAAVENDGYCEKHKEARIIKGVLPRIKELSEKQKKTGRTGGPAKPTYIHHVPLDFIPGIGAKTMDKLIKVCGSEMAAVHDSPPSVLKKAVTAGQARTICQMRQGNLSISAGGGGRYGKIII